MSPKLPQYTRKTFVRPGSASPARPVLAQYSLQEFRREASGNSGMKDPQALMIAGSREIMLASRAGTPACEARTRKSMVDCFENAPRERSGHV
jgi:hypothetical protein